MTERREGESVPETSEQVGNRILEFAQQAEFDSPEYQAISDYLHLKNLESNLATELRNARSDEKDSQGKDHWESKARITEQEIALHSTQIYYQQSRLKGYDAAFSFVDVRFEHDLSSAARREAESQYPQEPDQQKFYRCHTISDYFGKAEEIINQKSLNS